jgi:mannosyl-3-phosphoglycerate phosphatase
MKKENWGNAKKMIKELKFYYTEGGRYYHILGKNDKGKAVKILTKLYKQEFKKIKTVSLGDSENDVPMFKNTDSHFRVKGPKDWNKKVLNLLNSQL